MDKNKLKKQITIGILLIIIGIIFLIKDYIALKREMIFSSMNLELTELFMEEANNNIENNTTIEQVSNNQENSTSNEITSPEAIINNTEEAIVAPKKEETKVQYESYIGILNIPKINFSKGFYKKESSLNNVKYNIKILPQSNYPDEEKGNVIIIGHSGNYNNSYFANLYKLQLGDTVDIIYNNKKYTYKINNIYTDKKDGTVTIYRNETKNCLTLITCTKDDSTTQTIYILELETIE